MVASAPTRLLWASGRRERMPGPGPTEAPIELWHHDADSAYTLQPVVVSVFVQVEPVLAQPVQL